MHSVAWSAAAYDSLLDFFLVTKRITLNGSLALYPHYTNGYPLLLRAYYGVFGDGLVASRLFPICIVAVGGTLLVDKLYRELRNPLLYAALPLLFLSPIGRDAASFEFLEPAHFLVVGLSAALVLYNSTVPLWARAIAIVGCVVSLSGLGRVHIGDRFRRTSAIARQNRISCSDSRPSSRLLGVVVASPSTPGVPPRSSASCSIGPGWSPPTTRASHFGILRKFLATRIDFNLPPLFFLASIIEVVLLLIARRPLPPTLYLSFVVYAIVLRNFVGVHYFTFLPFMFFIILALMSFAWRIPAIVRKAAGKVGERHPSVRLKSALDHASHPMTTGVVVLAFLAYFAVRVGTTPRAYVIDERTRADVDAITAYVASHDLTRCSTFDVSGLLTDERIVACLLAKQVGRGAGETCRIALASQR